jgi:hypothetical protein
MKNLFALAIVTVGLALTACTTVEQPAPRTVSTTTEETTTVHHPVMGASSTTTTQVSPSY